MGTNWKYFVSILCLFFSYSIDSGNADFCYNVNAYPELLCTDNYIFEYGRSCCGGPGYYYCCTSDDYVALTDESTSTAVTVLVVIGIIIGLGTVGSIIVGLCCICGCVCRSRATSTPPVTKRYADTTQHTNQGKYSSTQVVYSHSKGGYPLQQQVYAPQAGAAYPPPSYPNPPEESHSTTTAAYSIPAKGEKPPTYHFHI